MRRIAANKPLRKSSPRRRGSSKFLNNLVSRLRGNDKIVLNQSFTRSPQQRLHQRGQALLILLMILGIGFGAWFYAFVSPTGSAIERDKITTAALAQVKEALIGWSAARTPSTSALIPPGLNARPGELPCPDTDNTGTDSGSCVAGAIGRVPWRSLGIPEPKDGAGETLWYAISGPYRNSNMSSAPITSDTLGNITAYQDNTSTTLTTPASTATTITTQAVAVIFSPGAPLGTQDRSPTTTMDCTAPSGTYARNICASNYLETWSSVNNATINGPFIQARLSDKFNDRLLVITNADLMPAVEQRVAREMISILQQYKAATATSTQAKFRPGIGVYPWADRSNGDSNDWNHNRFPCGAALPVPWNTTVPSSSPSTKTPDLPLWLKNGCPDPVTHLVTGWTSVIYYAVARNKLENNILVPCTNCTDNTLTVTNASNGIADLCPTTGTTCTPMVVSTSNTYDLLLITPGAATAYPRCASPPCWPTENFSLITGYFVEDENRFNNNDIYVVPLSTNYDRDRIYLVR